MREIIWKLKELVCKITTKVSTTPDDPIISIYVAYSNDLSVTYSDGTDVSWANQ